MSFPFKIFLLVKICILPFIAAGQTEPGPVGGYALLDTFIEYNARIPLNEPGGSVELRGIVEPDGSVSSLEIARSQNAVLDKEALRLMSLFKGWKPGEGPGQPARRPFNYTVHFRERKDRNYQNAFGAFEFFFDKAGERIAKPDDYCIRVIVPADSYGVPRKGNIEMSTLLNGKWVVFELGEVRYERVTEGLSSHLKSAGLDIFEVILNSNIYKTGLPRLYVTSDGQVVYSSGKRTEYKWYADGLLQSVVEREVDGGETEHQWYRGGLIKAKWTKEVAGRNVMVDRILMAYDSIGTPLLDNASGYLNNQEVEKGEGMFAEGYKSGLWKEYDKEGNLLYEEEYKKGILQKGVSYKEGKKYPYKVYRVLPEFKGGAPAMYSFLVQNTRYPADAARSNIQGKVMVSFVVTVTGEVEEVKTNSELGYGLEEAAINVVREMSGKWKPGTHRGLPARVRFTVPVNFALAP